MSSESVEVLFAKHTVDEIRDVEMKTRQEIETKKEDLRQMVGERYRDLIEAADTIAEMKQCAGNLSGAVKSLQKYTQIKFGYDDSGKKDKLHGFSIERYGSTVQGAYLIDMFYYNINYYDCHNDNLFRLLPNT